MSSLVEKLTEGRHRVAAEQYKNVAELKQSIDRDYVLIKFTETKGGTELGFKIDKTLTNLDQANFNDGSGIAHLVGQLTLDYQCVRFIADIDLSTLEGEGNLELLKADANYSQSSNGKTVTNETIH